MPVSIPISSPTFTNEVKRHNAVEVAAGLRRHYKSLPAPLDVRSSAIWFETQNFGWIMSAVDPATQTRKVLLKY
jgi:hypothetical protein